VDVVFRGSGRPGLGAAALPPRDNPSAPRLSLPREVRNAHGYPAAPARGHGYNEEVAGPSDFDHSAWIRRLCMRVYRYGWRWFRGA
jgi:hypothetical protein